MSSELVNDNALLLKIIALCWGLSVIFWALFVRRLSSMVEDEDRAYMDPLPLKMKLIWPFVQIIAFFFCSFLPYEFIEYTEKRLMRTGVGYLMNAEQFIALRIISAILVPVFVYILLVALEMFQPIWIILAIPLGFLFPDLWLMDTRKKRELAVIRSLPVYLDFITMSVEAGLNFVGALQQAMEKAPPGPLRNEFAIVMRDLRAGLSRAEALRRMADRLDIPEVTGFVSAVIQAEKMGASLANVMRLQAEQRRSERFQRAEKMAMEAPVKLMFPLLIFIFPVTFLVLAFTIAMKFLGEGSL